MHYMGTPSYGQSLCSFLLQPSIELVQPSIELVQLSPAVKGALLCTGVRFTALGVQSLGLSAILYDC